MKKDYSGFNRSHYQLKDIIFLSNLADEIFDSFERNSIVFYSEKKDKKIRKRIKKIKSSL